MSKAVESIEVSVQWKNLKSEKNQDTGKRTTVKNDIESAKMSVANPYLNIRNLETEYYFYALP